MHHLFCGLSHLVSRRLRSIICISRLTSTLLSFSWTWTGHSHLLGYCQSTVLSQSNICYSVGRTQDARDILAKALSFLPKDRDLIKIIERIMPFPGDDEIPDIDPEFSDEGVPGVPPDYKPEKYWDKHQDLSMPHTEL